MVHISHNMSQAYISSGIKFSTCHLHMARRQLLGIDTPFLSMLSMFILSSSWELSSQESQRANLNVTPNTAPFSAKIRNGKLYLYSAYTLPWYRQEQLYFYHTQQQVI